VGPKAGLDLFWKEANLLLLPWIEPRIVQPAAWSIKTVTIYMKSHRHLWSRKTPPQHIRSKTYLLRFVSQKEDNEPDSQTKPTWTVPNYLFPNTSVHIREWEREKLTKLKSKHCTLETSVRQDAATGLFEPKYCTVFSLFSPHFYLRLYRKIRITVLCSISVRSSLLWDVTQRRFVVNYRRFGCPMLQICDI
jgi:hypothetical protein